MSSKKKVRKSIFRTSRKTSKKTSKKIKLKKYYYLVKSDYLEPKKINAIFDKRGIWEQFDEKHPQQINPDYIYIDTSDVYDKSLWKYQTILKSIIDLSSDNYRISNKYNLGKNMRKYNKKSIERYLLTDHYINLYDIYRKNKLSNKMIEKYKYLFKTGKIWIFKAIYSMGGENIIILKTFDDFKKYIHTVLKKKSHLYKKLNYKKYNTMREIIKNKYTIEWVLQEYINNPLLIDKKKFHLRIHYIYDKSNNKNYLYDTSEVFTAKSKYETNDYLNKDIHDTHFTSTDKYYYFPKDFITIIGQHKVDSINKQLIELFKGVSRCLKTTCYPESENCFHIFGADVMITDDYKVKLIEINSKPGVRRSSNILIFENICDKIVDTHFIPSKKIKHSNT